MSMMITETAFRLMPHGRARKARQPANSFWNEARTKKLIAMWTTGYSGSQIADAIGGGLSRSAVIGKANRLNLEIHPKKNTRAPAEPKKKKKTVAEIQAEEFAFLKSPISEPPSLRFSILDVPKNGCLFATTADSPFLFCGHRQSPDSAYCGYHHAITHRPREG